jgi:hypothetical protein
MAAGQGQNDIGNENPHVDGFECASKAQKRGGFKVWLQQWFLVGLTVAG